jgi:ADP-ribose pyrophosphatase YjhB (NUDIX family)
MWTKLVNAGKKVAAFIAAGFHFVNTHRPTMETPWVKTTVFYSRRWGMKVGFELIKMYWFIARPEGEGAKCLILHQGKILLIRHTYGPRVWTIPGGGRKGVESLEDTARREVKEETGLEIDRLFKLGSWTHRQFHKEDTIHFFFGETWNPTVRIDRIEVEDADWFGPLALPFPVGENVQVVLKLYEEFTAKRTIVLSKSDL